MERGRQLTIDKKKFVLQKYLYNYVNSFMSYMFTSIVIYDLINRIGKARNIIERYCSLNFSLKKLFNYFYTVFMPYIISYYRKNDVYKNSRLPTRHRRLPQSLVRIATQPMRVPIGWPPFVEASSLPILFFCPE